MANSTYTHYLNQTRTKNVSNIELYFIDDLQKALLLTDEIGKWVHLISILFAFVGNLLILAGSRARKLALYRVLIRNLAWADLVYAVTQIFRVHARFNGNHWVFGEFLCRFAALSNIAIANSMLMLTFIAVERYRSLIYPLKPKLRRVVALRVTIALWVCAFLVDLPIMLFSNITDVLGYKECYVAFPSNYLTLYSTCAFLFIFVFPFLVTSVCYIIIGMHFLRGRKRRSGRDEVANDKNLDFVRSKRKTKSQMKMVTMLSLVVLALVLTTLPNHIYTLWHAIAPKKMYSSRKTFIILFALCHLVHFHSWTNSVIYSIMDRKFRRNLSQSICKGRQLFTKRKLSPRKKTRDLTAILIAGASAKKISRTVTSSKDDTRADIIF